MCPLLTDTSASLALTTVAGRMEMLHLQRQVNKEQRWYLGPSTCIHTCVPRPHWKLLKKGRIFLELPARR